MIAMQALIVAFGLLLVAALIFTAPRVAAVAAMEPAECPPEPASEPVLATSINRAPMRHPPVPAVMPQRTRGYGYNLH